MSEAKRTVVYRRFTRRARKISYREQKIAPVSAVAYDLRSTRGYLVADNRGRLVGRVEGPMYGTQPDIPDALAVRTGWFARKRRLVPAEAIDQIDGTTKVIGLRVGKDRLRRFL
jgi:hypothetical protein